MKKILVSEIFVSIQGEGAFQGYPFLFIRLGQCNLNCSYCDTLYAKEQYREMSINSILNIVYKNKINKICVTGGEPLYQDSTIFLLKKLVEKKYIVSLETNGSLILKNVPIKVIKVVDIKTPGSGEKNSFKVENFLYLTKSDVLKFVLTSVEDYIWMKKKLKKKGYPSFVRTVITTTSIELLEKIAKLVIKDKLNVKVQIQLHKLINLR